MCEQHRPHSRGAQMHGHGSEFLDTCMTPLFRASSVASGLPLGWRGGLYTALEAAGARLFLGWCCPPSSLLSAQHCLDPTDPPPPGRRQVTLAAGLMASGSLSPHPHARQPLRRLRAY